MFTHLPGGQKIESKFPNFPRQFQIAPLPLRLTKPLQVLKENPELYDKSSFNGTNFYRFFVTLFKVSSSQLKDQNDSDSPINTLLLHLNNEDQSLKNSNDQKNTDSEKKPKKECFLSPHKLKLMHLQLLKFLRNISYQKLTDSSSKLKT